MARQPEFHLVRVVQVQMGLFEGSGTGAFRESCKLRQRKTGLKYHRERVVEPWLFIPYRLTGPEVLKINTISGKNSYAKATKKKPATKLIAGFPFVLWCRRDESNTRPSHYE